MNKRKNISKKLRFEVFKRDNFTCQYCGRTAPDVVLEIDHINPVNNGGENDILNLITSCFDCNRGKGKRKLSQNDEIKKQQEQLKQLNEKRQQLEMMIEWKKELENFEGEQINKIEELFLIKNHGFSEHGRIICKKNIKKYGFDEVYECAKISLEQYYIENDFNSIEKAFNYIGRICSIRKYQNNNPKIKDIYYLIKIAKNRLRYVDTFKLKKFLLEIYNEGDFETLKQIFVETENWTDLKEELSGYYYREV